MSFEVPAESVGNVVMINMQLICIHSSSSQLQHTTAYPIMPGSTVLQ